MSLSNGVSTSPALLITICYLCRAAPDKDKVGGLASWALGAQLALCRVHLSTQCHFLCKAQRKARNAAGGTGIEGIADRDQIGASHSIAGR